MLASERDLPFMKKLDACFDEGGCEVLISTYLNMLEEFVQTGALSEFPGYEEQFITSYVSGFMRQQIFKSYLSDESKKVYDTFVVDCLKLATKGIALGNYSLVDLFTRLVGPHEEEQGIAYGKRGSLYGITTKRDTEMSAFVLSDECLGTLCDTAKTLSFLEHLDVFTVVFMLTSNRVDLNWGPEQVSHMSPRIKEVFDKAVSEITSKNLRSINDEILTEILCELTRFGCRNHQEELLTSVLDFGFFCLKSDYLKKQFIGAEVLCIAAASIRESDFFVEWVSKNDFISFMMERDLHEEILTNVTPYFQYFLKQQTVGVKQMMKLWERLNHCQPVQKRQTSQFVHAVFKGLDAEAMKQVIREIVKASNVSAENLEFLCTATMSVEEDVVNDILSLFFELRKDPRTGTAANLCLMQLAKPHYPIEIHKKICDYIMKELEGDKVHPSSLSMLKSLLNGNHASDSRIRDYSHFLDCLTKHINVSGIYGVLFAFLMKYSMYLSDVQIEKMFHIVRSSPKGWNRLIRLLDEVTEPFSPSGTKKLWDLVKSIPFDSPDITNEMIVFVATFIVVTASNEETPDPYMIYSSRSIQKLPCTGIDYLVDFYRSLQRNDERFAITCEYLLEVIRRAHTCPLETVAAFLIDCFLEAKTTDAKMNILSLIHCVVLYDYEAWVDTSEYSFKRHKEVKIPLITVYLKYYHFQSDVKSIRISGEAYIEHLQRAIAAKLHLRTGDVCIRAGNYAHHHRGYTLSQYGITDGTTVDVSLLSDLRIPQIPSDLLSYHLTPLRSILLEVMQQEGESPFQRQARRFISMFETDPILLSECRNNLGEYFARIEKYKRSFSYLRYLLEILVHEAIDISEFVKVIIDLVLTDGVPQADVWMKKISILLSRCSQVALKYRQEEILPLFIRLMTKTANAQAFLCYVNVLKLLLADPDLQNSESIRESLARVFLEGSVNCVSLLCPLFELLPDRAESFRVMDAVFDRVNSEKMEAYWALLKLLFTKDCNAESVVSKSVHLLHVKGVCDFLITALPENPNIVVDHPQLLSELVSLAFSEVDQTKLPEIFGLCTSLINSNTELATSVKPVLMHQLGINMSKWNFEPPEGRETDVLAGLSNLGATCYMNSVLQQLFHNLPTRKMIMESSDTEPWKHELTLLFSKMMYANSPSIDTRPLCSVLKFPGNEVVNTRIQQDATEFFQFLLDRCDKDVQAQYSGVLVNTIKGMDEEFETHNDEHFFSLCLPVRDFDCFDDSFLSILDGETFVGDNQYFAETLGRKINARKFTRIKSAGPCLVLQLKRFEYDLRTWSRYKIDDVFDFPDSFNLTPFTVNPDGEEQIYHLRGVIVHTGTLEGGHYTSLVRQGSEWICLNDDQTTEISERDFELWAYGTGGIDASMSPSAYMLFYSRGVSQKATIELSPEIRSTIEDENKKNIEIRTMFSTPAWNFITGVRDLEVLLSFGFNILAHAKCSVLPESYSRTVESLLNEPNGPEIGWNILKSKQETVLDIILHCGNSEVLMELLRISSLIVQRVSTDATADWLDYIIRSVERVFSLWRQINYFGFFVRSCLSGNDSYAQLAHTKGWIDFLIDMILKFYKTNKSQIAIQNVNFGHFFELIVECSGDFSKLIDLFDVILISNAHSDVFLQITLKHPELLTAVMRHAKASSLEMKGIILFQMISCATDANQMANVLSSTINELELTERQLATIIATSVTSMDFKVMQLVMDHPDIFFMKYLMSPSVSTASLMESVSLKLFPEFAPLNQYQLAESLAEETTSKYDQLNSRDEDLSWDNYESFGQTDIATATDVAKFNEFYLSCLAYMRNMTPTVKADIQSNGSNTRFVFFFRVLHWMILRLKSTTQAQLEDILAFMKEVRNPEFTPDCNMMEAIRVLNDIPEPLKSEFLSTHFDDLRFLVFPLDTKYSKFSRKQFSLFIRVAASLSDKSKLCEFTKTKDFLSAWEHTKANPTSSSIRQIVKAFISAEDTGFLKSIIAEECQAENNATFMDVFISELYTNKYPFTEEEYILISHWVWRHIDQAEVLDSISILARLNQRHAYHPPPGISEYLPGLILALGGRNRWIFEDYLDGFVSSSCEFRESLLSELANFLVAESESGEGYGFWSMFALYVACITYIDDVDRRQDLISQQFNEMIEHMEQFRETGAQKSFKNLTTLIEKFGYEENMTWASLLFALIMEQEVLTLSQREFATEVIRNMEEKDALGNFKEHFDKIIGSDYFEQRLNAEKAQIYYDAREDLQVEMLGVISLPDDAEEWWPIERRQWLQKLRIAMGRLEQSGAVEGRRNSIAEVDLS